MEKEKRIFYILGVGYSGSTLLNSILGSDENSVAVGEIQYFSRNIQENNLVEKCDCGENIYECKFWGPIIKKGYFDNLLLSQKGIYEPFINLLKIVFGFGYNKEYSKKVLPYKNIYEEIFNQGKKIYNKEINNIIDASKEVKKLYYLKRAGIDNIVAIYLIRDLRGVLCSYKRLGYSYLRGLIYFILTNISSRILLKRYFKKDEYILILYDDFVQNPDKYLENLKKRYGLNIDLDYFFKNYGKQENHSFGGNNARKLNFTKLKYIKKWEKLSFIRRWLLEFYCYIPNKIFFRK